MSADPPSVFDTLNEPFRAWYGEVEDAAFAQLDAALVVHSTPTGGSYTLVRGGADTTATPVRPRFGELRAVTHVPLSMYALQRRAPDLAGVEGATAAQRRHELLGLARAALVAVGTWPEPDQRSHSAAILSACIDALAAHEPLDAARIAALIVHTKPAVGALVAIAGEIQAHDCTGLLAAWRRELGEDLWARLVAIVGTAPAQQGPGTHGAIVRHALGGDPEADGRLIILVGLQDPMLLRHRLGVVLANRALASTWFGDPHRLESDLMTGPVTEALERLSS